MSQVIRGRRAPRKRGEKDNDAIVDRVTDVRPRKRRVPQQPSSWTRFEPKGRYRVSGVQQKKEKEVSHPTV